MFRTSHLEGTISQISEVNRVALYSIVQDEAVPLLRVVKADLYVDNGGEHILVEFKVERMKIGEDFYEVEQVIIVNDDAAIHINIINAKVSICKYDTITSLNG